MVGQNSSAQYFFYYYLFIHLFIHLFIYSICSFVHRNWLIID